MIDGPTFLVATQTVTIVIMNFHIETARPLCGDLSYPTHAYYAEAFTGNLTTNHKTGRPVTPLAGAYHAFTLARTTRRAQHQEHGNFGRSIGQDIGGIGDDNTFVPGCFQVTVINANGEIRDRFDTLRKSSD